MKAAVFHKIGQPLKIESLPDPTPGEGEVVVEVCRCGICGSDLHLTEEAFFGTPDGAVLGHEYSGRVAAVGKGVDLLKPGDHVAVNPVRGCGRCGECLAGQFPWCSSFRLEGGGYAEYSVAAQHQCVRLPKGVALEDGALVEPMAVGLHGVRLARLQAGAKVLIVGAGPIGLAVAYWARRLGATRVAVTAGSNRRAELSLTMGATHFVDAADNGPAAVNAALGGPPDVVFECVGKPGMVQRCIDYCKPRGTVILLGLCSYPETFTAFTMVAKEVNVQASAFYEQEDFEICADALEREAHIPRAMVTDVVTLDDMPPAFEALRQRSTQCKVLVDPRARS
ncbi:MAG: hypothetical protein RL026_835 [Pseudomonadota bacterium]|jgi:(R,R)-butanediol dehydrogenase/meso-butanediol dehydrogenase/diacetyl reductase